MTFRLTLQALTTQIARSACAMFSWTEPYVALATIPAVPGPIARTAWTLIRDA